MFYFHICCIVFPVKKLQVNITMVFKEVIDLFKTICIFYFEKVLVVFMCVKSMKPITFSIHLSFTDIFKIYLYNIFKNCFSSQTLFWYLSYQCLPLRSQIPRPHIHPLKNLGLPPLSSCLCNRQFEP